MEEIFLYRLLLLNEEIWSLMDGKGIVKISEKSRKYIKMIIIIKHQKILKKPDLIYFLIMRNW